jgi:thiamine pyrophosphate-dependent acetolactate synthase large subunit-like protein
VRAAAGPGNTHLIQGVAAHAEGDAKTSAPGTGRPASGADPAAVRELAARIDAADKIMIFAGIGCAEARSEVLAACRAQERDDS